MIENMEITNAVPRPPGLIFDTPKASEQAGLTLYRRSLIMDLTPESKICLAPEEKQRMEKYNAPSATMWSVSSKEEEFPPKQTIIILNGLASNPNQLENQGSSLVHTIAKDLGDDAKNVNIVSVSCPGFGGSNFTQNTLKEEVHMKTNTNVQEYIAMTKIWLKSMGLNPDNVIISGHSAGGEAAIHFAPEGYQVYALNPALHTKKSDIFRILSVSNQVTRYTQKSLPTMVNGIAQFITDKLVGSGTDAASLSQSQVHAEEQKDNQPAFRAKYKELIDPDEFPPAFDQKNLRVLITRGDILTPSDQSLEWIREWIEREQQNLLPGQANEIVNSFLIPLNSELSARSGHDALFINQSVANAVSSELSSLIQSRIHHGDFVRTTQPMTVFPDQARSEHSVVFMSDKKAQMLMYQGMTLELLIEGAKMIKEHTHDGIVQLSQTDKNIFINLFTLHPALQDKFGDTLPDEMKKYGGPGDFFTSLFYDQPYADLADVYHLFGDWEGRFTDALVQRPEIAEKIPGPSDKGKVSNVLVDSRGTLLFLMQNILQSNNVDSEIKVTEDMMKLNSDYAALELFRGVVRERFVSTIVGEKIE